MVPMWMFPVAIACGNTFVLKPSERDPSASLLIAELWRRAGLPDGVFNVVHGDKVAVDAILDSPKVAAVSFVGSTPIARYIHERASATGKRVQALGGAKNHAIVLPDADVDFAADHLAAAAFGSAGERCMAISAAVAVGSRRRPRSSRRCHERARAVKVGPGRDADSEMGPVVTREAQERIVGLIDTGEKQGAAVAVDGRDLVVPATRTASSSARRSSTRSAPTWTSTARRSSARCCRSCAPTTSTRRSTWSTPTPTATAPRSSPPPARRRAGSSAACNVGMIGINVPVPVPMAFYSFGGWKDSLFGDKHVHGPEGVSFYTRAKVVTARWPHATTPATPASTSRRRSDPDDSSSCSPSAGWGSTSTRSSPGVPLADVTTFAKFLGGTATNVAVGAARLGHRTARAHQGRPRRVR